MTEYTKLEFKSFPHCPLCINKLMICAIGNCSVCKTQTPSGGLLYCDECAIKLNKCVCCGENPKSAREYYNKLVAIETENDKNLDSYTMFSEKDKKEIRDANKLKLEKLKKLFDKDINASNMFAYMHQIRNPNRGTYFD